MYLVTSEQMRFIDHNTISTFQVPGIVLMDHAGRAVADAVAQRHPVSITVACGKGNNGGDGWTAARWLIRAGFDVRVVSSVHPQTLTGDAATAYAMAKAAGVPWCVYEAGAFASVPSVVVDALLGTGVSRALEEPLCSMVAEINALCTWVVSVDVPTGVDASTGGVNGTCIQASETIAIGYEKLGTAVTPGAIFAGQVRVVDIGLAPLSADVKMASYVQPSLFAKVFGQRLPLSHKGTYGRCGVYVGVMTGAGRLAAQAALRTGVGLVILTGAHLQQGALPPDFVIRENVDIADAFRDCKAGVIGPGLGESAAEVVRAVLDGAVCSGTCVIDADGLRGLGEGKDLRYVGPSYALTPHPKECARLLGWTTEQVGAERIRAAQTLAQATGASVLLKGYRTIIAAADGSLRVNPTGDASLAVGGSGDVLSGVVGSLLAQGLSPFDALSLGAWLHGAAGEEAGQRLTSVSVTASDIVECLPLAIRRYLTEAQGHG